jgi:hypothetical protein
VQLAISSAGAAYSFLEWRFRRGIALVWPFAEHRAIDFRSRNPTLGSCPLDPQFAGVCVSYLRAERLVRINPKL